MKHQNEINLGKKKNIAQRSIHDNLTTNSCPVPDPGFNETKFCGI